MSLTFSLSYSFNSQKFFASWPVYRHAGKIVGQGGPTGAKGHLLP